MLEIGSHSPINTNPYPVRNHTCFCSTSNRTLELLYTDLRNEEHIDHCLKNGGKLRGEGCYVPDVFLLSIILFAATYILAITLKNFKTKSFCSTKIRQVVCDFAVVISIASITLLDNIIGLNTPKLFVPEKFKVRLLFDL